MNHSEQRKRLRALLAGPNCLSPATVYDPLSARVAEGVGYEIGVLVGSLASRVIVAAPDLDVLTLTEYADQIRRIMRVSNLSLIVDADHGYGNALNVMRTVQELEHAGVSALTIEDTALPAAFGQGDQDMLVSLEEGVGKMRAAVAARSDPSLMVVARTSAIKVEGFDSALARAKAYATAGVDAIFIAAQPEKVEQLRAIHDATRLPIMVGLLKNKREELAACGVRILLQGQQSNAAAIRALRETYTHLFNGEAPADLKSKIASSEEIDKLVNADSYKQWLREFMN